MNTVEKFYRLVYDVEPEFVQGKGIKSGEYHYEEIPDYEPATYEELLELVACIYADAQIVLTHPRTVPVCPDVFDSLKKFKDTVDSSNIYHPTIMYNQRPPQWKLPESEVLKNQRFKDKMNKQSKKKGK